MKLELSRQSFEKYSDTKFHEYSYCGSRVVACERTAVQTETMKLIVSFRSSAKAHKISGSLTVSVSHFTVSAIQTVRSPVTNMAATLNPECILDKFNKTVNSRAL